LVLFLKEEMVGAVQGDRKLAQERLEMESQMDLSTELVTARAAFFEALDSGENVRVYLL
jgi:hypothetical protein